jgi:His/Glu/Gln/Arg/opine family amino acid ABC transporter permease subunit
MGYKFDFMPVTDGLPSLLLGCLGTFLLAICDMLLAIVIGICGVSLRDSRVKPLRWLVIAFVELIPNTPFLIQIFFLYFALPLATELTRVGNIISNQIFQPLTVLGVVGMLYFLMCFPLSIAGSYLERRFAVSER